MIDAVVRPGLPITERVLNLFGPPTWLWILLWGSISLIRPGILLAALTLSGQGSRAGEIVNVLPSQLVLAYVTVVTLWGTGRLVADARRLASGLTAIGGPASRPDFIPGLGSTIGPFVLLAAITTVSALAELRWGTTAVLADLPMISRTLLRAFLAGERRDLAIPCRVRPASSGANPLANDLCSGAVVAIPFRPAVT